jgi:hypothetical protein
MSTAKHLRTGAVLVALAMAATPAAFAQIKPAGFTEGIVRAVDTETRTLTVGAETYYVRGNTTTSLAHVHRGDEVELTYIVEGNRWIALDVKKTGKRGGILIFQYPDPDRY